MCNDDKINGCHMVYSCSYISLKDRQKCKYFIPSEDDEDNCTFFSMSSTNFYCDKEEANYNALLEEIKSFFVAFDSLTSHNVELALNSVRVALTKKNRRG